MYEEQQKINKELKETVGNQEGTIKELKENNIQLKQTVQKQEVTIIELKENEIKLIETIVRHEVNIENLETQSKNVLDVSLSAISRKSLCYVLSDLYKIPTEIRASRGLFRQLYIHMLQIVNNSISRNEPKLKDINAEAVKLCVMKREIK